MDNKILIPQISALEKYVKHNFINQVYLTSLPNLFCCCTKNKSGESQAILTIRQIAAYFGWCLQ